MTAGPGAGRATEASRRVPAIALTAYASAQDAERARASGFDRHVAKPVDPAVMVHAVLDLLSDRRPRA